MYDISSKNPLGVPADERLPPDRSLTGPISRPPNSARRPIRYDRHPETPVQTPQTLLRDYLPNHGSAPQVRHRNTDARLASLNHQPLRDLESRKFYKKSEAQQGAQQEVLEVSQTMTSLVNMFTAD